MELENWRKEIDAIDASMAELFGKRMAIAEKIGVYKKENRLPIHDPEREKEVLKKNLARLNHPERGSVRRFHALPVRPDEKARRKVITDERRRRIR